MYARLDDRRILIYSHDSFGLGHLRRCRAIANELVGRYKGISVLILSGSPVIGNFEFRARVDYVRIPGIIKLKDGSYTSLGLHIDLDQTLAIRESIIRHTAAAFDPDLFIVDKEPLGLEGEVKQTLGMLHERGTFTILGEREVIDDPRALEQEWGRKAALPALENLYDEIWVYGPEGFYNPFMGLDIEPALAKKVIYTGYLQRGPLNAPPAEDSRPYILVTPGGGKDGEEMVELVFESCLACRDTDTDVVFVLGPFMEEQKRRIFHRRAKAHERFRVIDYSTRMEELINGAVGTISMGGYNTFCEILSFDKPAIIIPRFEPRTEQLIRARRAAELGLVRMLEPENFHKSNLVPLIEELTGQAKPSERLHSGMLDGMNAVCRRVEQLLNKRARAA
jgi:predicted glycosyltransferase